MLSFKEFQEEVFNFVQVNKISYGFEYSNLTEEDTISNENFLYMAKNKVWRTVIGYSFLKHPDKDTYGSWVLVINFPSVHSNLDFALSKSYLENRHDYYPTLQEALDSYE